MKVKYNVKYILMTWPMNDYFLMQWFLLGSCFIFYMENQVETQNHDQIKQKGS